MVILELAGTVFLMAMMAVLVGVARRIGLARRPMAPGWAWLGLPAAVAPFLGGGLGPLAGLVGMGWLYVYRFRLSGALREEWATQGVVNDGGRTVLVLEVLALATAVAGGVVATLVLRTPDAGWLLVPQLAYLVLLGVSCHRLDTARKRLAPAAQPAVR